MDKKLTREANSFLYGVISGSISVPLAGYVNGEVYKRFGRDISIGVSAPIIEELLKSGLAYGTGGNLLMSHVSFGSIEGAEYGREGYNSFDYLRSILHAVFGLLHVLGNIFGGSRLDGFVWGVLGHMAWNNYALYNQRKRGVGASVKTQEITVDELRQETWNDVKRSLLI